MMCRLPTKQEQEKELLDEARRLNREVASTPAQQQYGSYA